MPPSAPIQEQIPAGDRTTDLASAMKVLSETLALSKQMSEPPSPEQFSAALGKIGLLEALFNKHDDDLSFFEELAKHRPEMEKMAQDCLAREAISERGASAPKPASMPAIISTFTSAQEREALRRALAKGRRIIQVIPQGIPRENDLPPELQAACREGRALLLSPQPPDSRLNKKVATWCNEYVLRHANEIWAGYISANGMLAAMLKALGRGA